MAELSHEYEKEIPELMSPKIVIVGIKDEHLLSEKQFVIIVRRPNCSSFIQLLTFN